MRQKKSSLLFISIIFLVFCLLYSLPLRLNNEIADIEAGILYKFRGSRSISENIFVVYIGDEDVSGLHGWPFTRDYFSYAIHALKSSGARTIAVDILFSGPDTRYINYDKTLADFISSAGNVCLPMIFSELTPDSNKPGLFVGKNPQFSFDPLPELAAGTGFSNFSLNQDISRTPLLVKVNGDTIRSFAFETLYLYLNGSHFEFDAGNGIRLDTPGLIPVNRYGELWINYFGDPDLVPSISFVNLLQTFRNNPGELNLQDKLVIIITTASGVAQVKSTPIRNAIPASLIHVNVIDNILQQNWLRKPHMIISWLILFLCVILVYLLWHLKNILFKIVLLGLSTVFYFIIATWIFSSLYTVIPFIYPAILSLFVVLILGREKIILKHEKDVTQRKLLNARLIDKEEELELSRADFKAMQDKLLQESSRSDISIQQIANQQSLIDQLENELRDLRSYIVPKNTEISYEPDDLIHSGEGKMVQVVEMISKVSNDNIPVLILGETGTGKELIAREIHKTSPRRNSPFIAINCGALSESLLESELFGHKKGSFTGAISDRKGRFELADGGTVFLDEITETTPAFQIRLLRILQESTFEPVGSENTIKIDIRVIAATNKNIKEIMQQELFRADLYYRLNGFLINLPPLRERTDDIALMTNHFIKKHGYATITKFSERAMELLCTYNWPGNVRELENTIRRAAILASSENRSMIQEDDLPEEIQNQSSGLNVRSIHQPIEEQILELLRSLKFSRSAIIQTAKALGDRDRGTITEYFRGLCFESLVNSNFNKIAAARMIAGTDDPEINNQVISKLENYIENLYQYAENNTDQKKRHNKLSAPFRGLPKKYHTPLDQVLQNINKIT